MLTDRFNFPIGSFQLRHRRHSVSVITPRLVLHVIDILARFCTRQFGRNMIGRSYRRLLQEHYRYAIGTANPPYALIHASFGRPQAIQVQPESFNLMSDSIHESHRART